MAQISCPIDKIFASRVVSSGSTILIAGNRAMNYVIANHELAASNAAGVLVDDCAANRKRTSVLFVCWGNVCRSPAATSVLQKYLATRNLESLVRVDSAGVAFEERLPKPSFAMRWVAFRRGYRLKRRARRINRIELNYVDLVIALDRRILRWLHALHKNPTSRIKLLSEFLPSGWPRDVPDPMNRSSQICNRVFDMLELACPKIAESLGTTPRAVEPTGSNLHHF